MSCPQSLLPAGFRFHPTDEELILHYLMKKAASLPLPVSIIAEVDIYKYDPWDLPAKAAFGEKEWYFFSQRDRKYPNGARPNRAAASGYWKATGTDKVIASSSTCKNIGVKKALVFYEGKPPKGIKTAWIMHEYRLPEGPNYGNFNHKPPTPRFRESSSMRLDDWVLCRVYKKSNLSSPHAPPPLVIENDTEQSENHTQGPTISTYSNNNILQPQKSSSFSNLLDMDYTLLNSFLFDNNPDTTISSPTLLDYSQAYSNQPLLSNYTTSVHANDNTSIPFMDNQLKHQRSNHDIDASPQAKRCTSSWTSRSGTSQFDENSQYKFFEQGFLGQDVILSPKFQFQG